MPSTAPPDTLAPNRYVDSDHPRVIAYAKAHAGDDSAPIARAVSLYYAVRDGWRYSPWNVHFEKSEYAASTILARDPDVGAHCIDKALVLAAACRVFGIPSRLHFANVRNHIGTARLEATLGTDLLVYHGYAELFLEGRWVAATPAFNTALCQKLGVQALEFDGRSDSIFQEYDAEAGRFMEYVTDHGTHAGIPFDAMVAAWRHHYTPLRESGRWPEPR